MRTALSSWLKELLSFHVIAMTPAGSLYANPVGFALTVCAFCCGFLSHEVARNTGKSALVIHSSQPGDTLDIDPLKSIGDKDCIFLVFWSGVGS